ncbi:MAG: hypothetical protein AAF423_07845 [Pseudomonadota bacterium]
MTIRMKFNGLISKVGDDYCIGFPALPSPILLCADDGLDDGFKTKIIMALTEYFEDNTILEEDLYRDEENIEAYDNEDGDLFGLVPCEMEKTETGYVTVKVGRFPE